MSTGHFFLRAGAIWILVAFCCTSNSFTRSGWLRSGRLCCGESANPPQNPVGGFTGVLKMRLASKYRASHSKQNKCWLPLQAKRRELDVKRLRWNWFQWKGKKKVFVHSDHFSADKNELNCKNQYATEKKIYFIFSLSVACCFFLTYIVLKLQYVGKHTYEIIRVEGCKQTTARVAWTHPSAAVWQYFYKAGSNSNLRYSNTNGIAARCSP